MVDSQEEGNSSDIYSAGGAFFGLSCVSVSVLVIGKKAPWSRREAGVSCIHVAGLGIIIVEKGGGVLNNPASGWRY